ncbi:MAG: mannonate dehydratase [Bryobacteraceae bacterium]|nr:mannonate dehydratase [Bryobacteraceae bacterium]
MKIGTQHADDDATLKIISSFGVKNICSSGISRKMDEKWSVDSLKRLRERVESHGISLDMVPIPMSSSPIERAEMPDILLDKGAARDRDIDSICQMIRNCAAAGIPAVKYNLTFLGVVRTEATPGRGAAMYSTFVYDKAKQDPPLTAAGRITPDIYWERITYFLEKVVPVAAESKVRIACHPQDPGMPHDRGYRGVNTVLGSFDGMKKFISIKENPYHGLNFCQGTVSEMLENPNKEIHDIIRYFGKRKKIFNVHFRNIRGKFLDFKETFPDDGDIDMLQAARTYKEVGYDGMLMPDHVPKIPGDEGGRQAFAFAFGYIQAALQMTGSHA